MYYICKGVASMKLLLILPFARRCRDLASLPVLSIAVLPPLIDAVLPAIHRLVPDQPKMHP